MSTDRTDEDQPAGNDTIDAVGQQLDAGHATFVIEEILVRTQDELNENLQAIRRLLPYLSGLYYTDCQRRYAERELFRLQSERLDLEATIRNALVMAPNLLYRVDAIAHI